ncbi:DNRLRE domain-containing protein [Herbidospora sp. RD11066]
MTLTRSLLVAALVATGLAVVPAAPARAVSPSTIEVVQTLNPVDDTSADSSTDENLPATPNGDLLAVGSWSGGQSRAYLKFDTSDLPAGVVTSATLRLGHHSAQCGTQAGDGIQVRRLTEPWTSDFLHWGNKPDSTAEDAVTTPVTCDVPVFHVEWPVEGIVQDWVDGAANEGFVLQSPDEGVNGGWSLLASTDQVDLAWPRLTVTITVTSTPELRSPYIQPTWAEGGTTKLITHAPRFFTTVFDPIGGKLRGEFVLEDDATGQIWSGLSLQVSSGRLSMVQVPAGVVHDGQLLRWRSRAHNVSTGVVSGWSSWQQVVVDLAPPDITSTGIAPSLASGGTTVTTSLTPELRAVIGHRHDDLWWVVFEVEHAPDVPEQGAGVIWTGGPPWGNLANGPYTAVVPAGRLSDGWKIRWRVRATSTALVAVTSDWQEGTVDTI